MDKEEMKRVMNVWASSVALLCYCYTVVRSVPKGTLRLISLLPIFFLLSLLPLSLSSFQLAAPAAFLLVWLCNFKLLLFFFEAGPLIHCPSCLRFVLAAALPIKIKPSTTTMPAGPPFPKARVTLPAKALVLALLHHVCEYRSSLHPYLVWLLYGACIFFGIELVLALYSLPGQVVLSGQGIELEPQFNEPLLSTSLEDFWGRRWNLTVSAILREAIYDPIRAASLRWAGRRLGSYVAVLVTFTTSGLMHEVVFYYFIRSTPTWEVTVFFLIQGGCVVAEKEVKRRLRGRWRPNKLISRALTLGFLGVMAIRLIGVSMVESGVDEKAIRESRVILNFLKEKAGLVLASYILKIGLVKRLL
ncbi:hypothetical protein SAY87_021843 [Trapa incisa]|uniref:Wax synthase domain-containing protein n=1 Tax=Trapa incisa TaxID=236973 RepID=A0AAN7JRL9_9MYRT|nr:hypothetical protein SAY87_021843 [Trapa incisa]